MGLQSSRIIWGKRTDKDADLTPITLYDPDYTIYTYDNQCIFENKLYKCITAETGGSYFSTEEWKEIKGVTTFSTTKSYKVGAICIYSDYVYRCIQPVIYTNYDPVVRYPDQYPDYWAQQNQSTGLVYSPRDHKDVYYDNGRNAVKWHRMMYYIPPENVINLDLPISLYVSDGEYMYKKDDYCLGYDIHNRIGLYKCRANIPIHEEWNPSHWDRIDNVELFDPVVAYNKGDEVIYLLNEMVSQYVSTFRQDLYYSAGQYILDVIQRKVEGSGGEEYGDDYENLFDQAYVNRIDGGETIYGCFVLTQDIPANSSSYFDHDIATLLDYKQYDGSSSVPSTIGEKFIQHIEGGWVLSEVVPAPIETGRPFDYKPIEQLHRQFDTYYLFRSIKDQNAGYFKRDEWIMEYQNYDTQWEQGYGVIWQKLGNPGSAGRPFYYPYALAFPHDSYPHLNVHTRLGSFFPYLGDNKLEPNETVRIYGEYNYSTGKYVCSSYKCGTLMVANKLQVFCYMDSDYIKSVLSLVKFTNNWAALELSREADPDFGIVPINTGFLYVSDTEPTPGYYDIYKVTLNGDSSSILNEAFAFTVPVSTPSIDGEIGGLTRTGRYNGFFETEMWYRDTYRVPIDSDFGWENDPAGWPHETGPFNYSYPSVIFEDGSVQRVNKIFYLQDDYVAATSRASNRYLINELLPDVAISDYTVVRYSYVADRNAVISACNYWNIPYTIDDTDHIISRIPRLAIGFGGDSFSIYWKLCNKEGTTCYFIVLHNRTYKTINDEIKRFICSVIVSLNKYGANDTKIIFKNTYDNPSDFTPEGSLTPFYLYNQDDTYIYCVTSDYKIIQINLQNGNYEINGLLNNDYLIKDIPYYNNDTFHSFRGMEYYDIKKANIRLTTGQEDDYQENYIFTIYNAEDESIDILWNVGTARKAYLNAYCDSNSGSPTLSHGVFVTGRTAPTNLGGTYNIALYIPNFKSNPSNAGAFFWFSSLGWYGHPCYGGEDEDGFEGW